MKKHLLILGFLTGLILSLNLQAQDTGKGLEAYFSYGIFNNPTEKPYVETYFSITGRSLKWKKNAENTLESKVEIMVVLWEDTNIISYSKEILNEKLIDDSLRTQTNLTYMQRLEAKEGKIRIQVRLDDLNDTIRAFETGTFIEVNFPKDSLTLSSIMPVKSFSKTTTDNRTSKSGYDLIPAVFNFFPNDVDEFTFYTEIYPGKKLELDEPFLAVFYLLNHESNQVLANYKSYKRMKAAPVNVLLHSFNIENLWSGNFELVIEIRDSKNNLLGKNYFFLQRENKKVKPLLADVTSMNIANTFAERIKNKDTLELILRSMNPISAEIEKNFTRNLIAQGEVYYMQQYLLHFWEQRDPNKPEEPFKAYMAEVAKAEQLYKTMISHGFETDRGRVFLQYGPPNTVVKNYNEPSAYPYEIWHYYTLKNQRNRRFVFYNTDLSSNDFALLHSDALGEPRNHQWRLRLRARDTGYESIEDTGANQTDWGSQYNEWYLEPR